MGYLANFERVLAELLVPSIGEFERRQAIQELRLPESTRWAAKKTDTDESIAAERYIRGVMVHTLVEGMQSLTKGDLARARAELEIAAECTPDDGFVLYQLARAYALGKDQRRALTVLRESVENGFSDLDQSIAVGMIPRAFPAAINDRDFATALEPASSIRAKQVSSVELTNRMFARID